MKDREFSTIRELLENSRGKYKNNIAFRIRDTEGNFGGVYRDITYKEFLQEIRMLATSMLEQDLKRVAIIGQNSYYWVLVYYAAVCAGITVIPLDKGLPAAEIAACLDRSGAGALYFDSGLAGTVEEALTMREDRKPLMVSSWGKTNLERPVGCLKEELRYGRTCLLNGSTAFDEVSIEPDAAAIILFTSGTTSRSKAVLLSNRNITSNVFALNSYIDFYPSDVNMVFLPLHHTFGSTGLLMMLSDGMMNVFCDGLKYIQKNLVEYKVSVFVGVPLLVENMYAKVIKQVKKTGEYEKLLRAISLSNFLRRMGLDLRRRIFKSVREAFGGNLRLIVSGASALSKDVAKGFNELGIITVQGYGLTETSPVISAEKPDSAHYGSVGQTMCNVEARIASPDENGVGELVVRGPNVMLGYLDDSAETAKVMEDGWFHTGDLATIDKDGFIFIKGRQKNVIVLRNGKNVFPEELEELIGKLPYVRESLVYGQSRDSAVESDAKQALGSRSGAEDLVVSARVVFDRAVLGEDCSYEEAMALIQKDIDAINETLPKYKRIQRLSITEEVMEKTTTMKIKRYKVLAQ